MENVGYKNALNASCNYHKLTLITLFHSDKWQSHRNKDSYLKEYLHSVHPEEVILFTDGYDTIFIGDEKSILDRYKLLSNGGEYIVVSAEENCYPHRGLESAFPIVSTPYRFLNSGGIIGKAEQLLEILAAIEQESKNLDNGDNNLYKWSNQYLWTLIYLKKTHKIVLDNHCALFQAFVNDMETTLKFVSNYSDSFESKFMYSKSVRKTLSNFKLGSQVLQNISTGTFPVHLHFNGPIMKNSLFQYPFNSFIEQYNNAKMNHSKS